VQRRQRPAISGPAVCWLHGSRHGSALMHTVQCMRQVSFDELGIKLYRVQGPALEVRSQTCHDGRCLRQAGCGMAAASTAGCKVAQRLAFEPPPPRVVSMPRLLPEHLSLLKHFAVLVAALHPYGRYVLYIRAMPSWQCMTVSSIDGRLQGR
jgi:hypothetical protein